MRRVVTVLVATAALAGAALAPAHAGTLAEKDVNLDESLRLARLLDTDAVDVLLTRSHDVFVPLGERTDTANAAGADLFVAVHNNSSADHGTRGTELYAQVGREPSIALAQRIHDSLTAATGLPGRGVIQRSGKDRDYYFVLRNASMAAVIVEGAYLSNVDDARLLASPAFRQRMAEGIAAGIVGHLGSVPATAASTAAPPPRGGHLATPTSAHAEVAGHTVSVTFGTVPRATGYRLFRDGAPVADVRTSKDDVPVRELAGENTGPEHLTITDLAAAGVHRYEVRATLMVQGQVVEESPSATVPATVPWLVAIDAGHGGRDPGAIGRT